MSLGTVKLPSLEQLGEIATELGFTLSPEDLAAHREALRPGIAAYNLLDRLPDELPPVPYPRRPGRRPLPEENPYGAWYVKSEVTGAATGKHAGKRVALKDNICLAGVPMMNGASTLEGYVPDVDATVVTRILDAGGTIAGKTVCEYFCFSGGSHTSASGPVHNPHRPGYSAGGSSSGSAAVVAAGEVPMALGGDQGGSIRIPAAFCGIYGLKPTYGLVPYTGVMPIELTLDHIGPMTATGEDNALLLEVVAGPDGLAARRRGGAYHCARRRGVWTWPLAAAGRCARARGGRAVPRAGGARRDRVDPDASPGIGDLAADRRRRRVDADDARQRLRLQLAGALRHLAARLPQRLEESRRRAVRQPQEHDAARPCDGDALSRALLCQGAKPGAAAARRL